MRLSMKSEGGGSKEKVAGAIHAGAWAWSVHQVSGEFTGAAIVNRQR